MCIGIIRNNSLVDGRSRAESNPGHWARHTLLHMAAECVNHSATKAGRLSNCITLPNFIEITPTAAKNVSIFQDDGHRHLGFLKQFFNGRNGQKGGTASAFQISSKSLELLLRYGVFGFFKMAAAAILNFQNFERTPHGCRTVSPCQISL